MAELLADLFIEFRVGNYRIAYQVNDGELVVLVVKVGNRRDIHRHPTPPRIATYRIITT